MLNVTEVVYTFYFDEGETMVLTVTCFRGLTQKTIIHCFLKHSNCN